MTRFVVDSSAVLHLASAGIEVPAEHELGYRPIYPTLSRPPGTPEPYEPRPGRPRWMSITSSDAVGHRHRTVRDEQPQLPPELCDRAAGLAAEPEPHM